MLNHSLVRERIRLLAPDHLPRNTRHYEYKIYDDKSTLRNFIDPEPFEGIVIDVNDAAILLKTSRTEFAAVDKALTNKQVSVGSKVLVTPYARRRFDGKRADTPKEELCRDSDGTERIRRTWVLGDVTVRLPLPKARCAHLARLIQHLETLPAPDGFRKMSHLLVDAGAYDFSCVDPPEDGDVTRIPPAVCFHVSNLKFDGLVKVSCEPASEKYAVELHRDGSPSVRVADLDAPGIGRCLGELIDDGCWLQVRIEVLASKTKRRSQ
jgi:hypothetical protein